MTEMSAKDHARVGQQIEMERNRPGEAIAVGRATNSGKAMEKREPATPTRAPRVRRVNAVVRVRQQRDRQYEEQDGTSGDPFTNAVDVTYLNFQLVANISVSGPVRTHTASEIMMSSSWFNTANRVDQHHANPMARDRLLVGWKFVKEVGKGAHGISSLWAYMPLESERLLRWPDEDDLQPVQKMVVKQCDGAVHSLVGEAEMLGTFTKLGCCHFPRIYDDVRRLRAVDGMGTSVDRIFMEYFANGSLAEYMRRYQKGIPSTEDGLHVWQTDPLYGYRGRRGERRRVTEKALWSLFVCLAKGVLAAESGREHVVGVDTEDTMKGEVFVPLGLCPENVLVGARSSDAEHRHFPRTVWGGFSAGVRVPRDWSKCCGERRTKELSRLRGMFPDGVPGDRDFMAPEQRQGDWELIGTATSIWLIGGLMWWCINLGPLGRRSSGDNDMGEKGTTKNKVNLSRSRLMEHSVYSSELRMLIASCLSPCVLDRPNADALVRATISGLCRAADENIVSAEKDTRLPERELLVRRLRGEYDYEQKAKQGVRVARRLFKEFTGNEFIGCSDSIVQARFLKDGRNIADQADNLLADGLVFEAEDAVISTDAGEREYKSQSIQLSDGLSDCANEVVELRMWPAAVRATSASNTPWNVRYSFKAESTIRDLKVAVRRVHDTNGDGWKKDAIVHIYPHNDERSLGSNVRLSDIVVGSSGHVELDCICVRRKGLAVEVKKPVWEEWWDSDIVGDKKRSEQREKEVRQYWADIAKYTKASSTIQKSGEIDVSRPYSVRVWLWPRGGRSSENICRAKPLECTICTPWKTTIQEMREGIEKAMRSRYGIALTDTECVRLYESGPANAIHVGAGTALRDNYVVSCIVLSREQYPNGDIVVRNIDAVIETICPGKKRKTVEIDMEIGEGAGSKVQRSR